jgi:autotransporter-associated beta strand protein
MNAKTKYYHPSAGLFVLLMIGLVQTVPKTTAQTLTWTNSADDLLWSSAANWSPNDMPADTKSLVFGNTLGCTNVQGAVNNIVDTDMVVSNLSYAPVIPNYHTTLIMPGKTLAVNTVPTPNTSTLKMSAVVGAPDVGYVKIMGSGNASLVCGNVANPNPVTSQPVTLDIRYVQGMGGTQTATLDLSELDNFTFGGGIFRVGSYPGNTSAENAARGTVILARTNLILAATLAGQVSPNQLAGILVGVRTSTLLANDVGDMQLGVTNTLWTDVFKIGCYGSNDVGTVRFRPDVLSSDPALWLRSVDGASRVNLLGIGNSHDQTTSITGTGTGTLDLTGGTVDALVNNLFVGRNNGGTTTSRFGSGSGTLTWTAGTFDVLRASIGAQAGNNRGNAKGVVNVLSNAVLLANSLDMGSDLGTASGTGQGTLNIANGGQVIVATDLLEDTAAGVDGSSTINITRGTLTVGGSINVDTINLSDGTVSNATTLTATVAGNGTLANILSFAGTLSPGTPATAGVITNLGNFIGNGSATLTFSLTNQTTTGGGMNDYVYVAGDVAPNGASIKIVPVVPLATGTYRLIDYSGTQSSLFTYVPQIRNTALDQVSPNQVNLVVSGGGSSLVWAGASTDWDIVNSYNWNNGTDQFYQWDTVTFDDTGITQPSVNLPADVYPLAVTVDTTGAYSFGGPGRIAGPATLTKNGAGTLTVANTNSFTGAVAVNGGSLLVNGSLGSGTVTVNNSAILGGSGTIPGSVTVASGGTLSPGTSLGTLTVAGSLNLTAGSTNFFELNSDTLAHDQARGLSSVTYGGTLVLSATGGGTALTNGAAVRLFSAGSFSGAFAAYSLPALTPPLHWDTSALAASGTLRISSVPNTPTNITAQVTGNTLEISWPAEYTTWRLLAQTNAAGQGLSATWYEVPGSSATNRMSFTIDPANGSVFYRLVYP